MSEITPFDFNGHAVRVITIDGEPWWVVLDVCKAMGIENASMAAARIKEHNLSSTEVVDSAGRRNPRTVIINEPGLMQLIMRSDVPAAEPFQEWVYEDVLPTIRRTGSYSVTSPAPVSALDALAGMVEALREQERAVLEMKRAGEATRQLAQAAHDAAELAHFTAQDAVKMINEDVQSFAVHTDDALESLAADVADLKELSPVTAPLLLTLRDVAHAYDPSGKVGQNKMAKILKDTGILFEDHQGGYRIHQPWIGKGWGKDEFEPWQNGKGWAWVTKFTPAGLAEIMRRLRAGQDH